LARRLITEGVAKPEDITVFDPNYPRATGCKISPCAWGLHYKTLKFAARKCALDWKDYLLNYFGVVWIEGMSVQADLCTFNKPKFIADCLDGINVQKTELSGDYDIIIDATAWRKIIGPGLEEIRIITRQAKIERDRYPADSMSIRSLPFKGFGYYWEFPIGDYVHVGYGVATDIMGYDTYKQVLSDIPDMLPKADSKCKCGGVIRASSPEMSKPLVKERRFKIIIAIGESAGCISSATGGGNKEAIDCVELLLDCWEDWPEYSYRLCKEFKWAHKEYLLVRKLCFGKRLNIFDYWTLKKNAKRYGIKLGLKEAWKMVKKVLR
jgi:hypothetical protein